MAKTNPYNRSKTNKDRTMNFMLSPGQIWPNVANLLVSSTFYDGIGHPKLLIACNIQPVVCLLGDSFLFLQHCVFEHLAPKRLRHRPRHFAFVHKTVIQNVLRLCAPPTNQRFCFRPPPIPAARDDSISYCFLLPAFGSSMEI